MSTPEPNTGCWLWCGTVNSDGYGQLRMAGRTTGAHRLSYEAFVGPVGPGLCVCHKCDVPCCANPDHLFLGTHADNAQDRSRKGRTARMTAENHWSLKYPFSVARGDRNGSRTRPERRPRGDRHGLAKLTADSVAAIRTRVAAGESYRSLAKVYGVSHAVLRQAALGITWSHIPRT